MLACATGDVLNDLVSVLSGVTGSEDLYDSDDSEMAVVSPDTSNEHVVESNPLTLMELCSRVVAKHCTCAELEKYTPTLDERLLRRVVYLLYLIIFSMFHCSTVVCRQDG